MDSKVYSRATEYGFAVAEHELVEKVRLEDERRFREEMKKVTFKCPECGKEHKLNKDVLNSLIETGFKKGELGKTGLTTFCSETEVLLDMMVNCRTNNFSTPFHDIKKQNVKISVSSLNELVFEHKDFEALTDQQIQKIFDFHKDKKTAHSENMVLKAMKEKEIRKTKTPNLEVEAKEETSKEETPKKKAGFFSNLLNR